MWVGNDVGTIAYIGDMTVSMDDIRYDIDHNVDAEMFGKWYFKSLDVLEITGEHYMNYPSYCMGAPDYWSDERLNRVRKLKETIENEKRELNNMVMRFKKEPPTSHETGNI